jgi:hypothetical protein
VLIGLLTKQDLNAFKDRYMRRRKMLGFGCNIESIVVLSGSFKHSSANGVFGQIEKLHLISGNIISGTG